MSKKILALVISAGMLSGFAFGATSCESCFASSDDSVVTDQYTDSDTAVFFYMRDNDEEKIGNRKTEDSSETKKDGSFVGKAVKGVGKFAASVCAYSAVGVSAVEATDKIGYTDSSQFLDRAKDVSIVRELVKDGWNVKSVVKNAGLNRDKLENVVADFHNSVYTVPVCLAVGGVVSWLGKRIFGLYRIVGKLVAVATGAVMAFSKKDSFYNSVIKPVAEKVVDKVAEKL